MKKTIFLKWQINSIRSEQGSLLILVLSMMPIILSLIFGISIGLHWIYFRMQVQKDCFHETWQGQKQAQLKIEKLLALNPRSTLLKTEYLLMQQQLAVAITQLPESTPLVIQLQQKLKLIQEQRQLLNTQQQQIQIEAKYQLNRALQKTVAELNQDFQNYHQVRTWMIMHAEASSYPMPGLAVRPESSDLAPNYKTADNFEFQQALNVFWKAHLQMGNPLNQLFDKSIDWDEKCTTTIGQKNNQFQVKIKEDKSLSRPLHAPLSSPL